MKLYHAFATVAVIAMAAPLPVLAQGKSENAGAASAKGKAISQAAKNPETRGRAKAYDIICRVMAKDGPQCTSLLKEFTQTEDVEDFMALCEEYLFDDEQCEALFYEMYPEGEWPEIEGEDAGEGAE